ncbi:MAG TPA: flavodoxin-dependent (E)-4-hydroxy-3-methylbut-2-enyl-diphosphate synthase [bacterium]|nr:flavodoxin-dependent (E)-4-hydroxy-3-methylbut-2-enyl-diphosphate synthase [bacterium]
MNRTETRRVQIGPVPVGGGAPIAVQSMTTTDTRDADATVAQILALEQAGCEIARVAVPDRAAADALPAIKARIHVPLVADIHFDYRLALAALVGGVDKLRLNPGNIGSDDRVRTVAREAKARGVPIRVGANVGSLSKEMLRKYGEPCAAALVDSALDEIRILEDLDFHDIVVSVKASDVEMALDAYTAISERTAYPLHVGITEAGTTWAGTVKSAVGLGAILSRGIGDTIRVSLATDPVEEIKAGFEILKSLGLRMRGPILVACPSCGRADVDIVGLAEEVERRLAVYPVPVKVAVMGCAVNGPGEARMADLGVACGKGMGLIFKRGRIVASLPEAQLLEGLMKEVEVVVREKQAEAADAGVPAPVGGGGGAAES